MRQNKKIPLKIGFCDYWETFNPCDNVFTYSLLYNDDIIVYDKDCLSDDLDLIIYSDYGYAHCEFNKPKKLYFTIENMIPNYNECDYSISSIKNSFNSRNLYIPEYTYNYFKSFESNYDENEKKYYEELEDKDSLFNRRFASIMISNESSIWHDKTRERLFDLISEYSHVDSAGTWNNNMKDDAYVSNKLEFISKYKFNLAFENSSVHGYTTEKIIDAFSAHTIPIYWGNEDIYDLIQPNCFIFANKYDDAHLIEEINRINNDKDAYLEMLMHPKFTTNINYVEILKNYILNIVYDKPKRMVTAGFNLERQNILWQLNDKMRKEIYAFK